MSEVRLTPGQRFEVTNAICLNHADRCPVCGPPSLDRATAGCREGRRLEQQWLRHWRARVDTLSDRWSSDV